jgi:hypothetical protein
MTDKDPLLELTISRYMNSCKIMIRDNGPGLNSNIRSQAPAGTGKGLQIIDEMIDLFYQLEGVRIKYTLEDISQNDTDLHGTVACINIPE